MKNNHIDTFGVPEFFTTNVIVEDAGNGLVRLVKGIYRNSVFQPVYTVVQPAITLLRTQEEIMEIARQILGMRTPAH